MNDSIPWGIILLLLAVGVVLYLVKDTISTAGHYWYIVIPLIILFFLV